MEIGIRKDYGDIGNLEHLAGRRSGQRFGQSTGGSGLEKGGFLSKGPAWQTVTDDSKVFALRCRSDGRGRLPLEGLGLNQPFIKEDTLCSNAANGKTLENSCQNERLTKTRRVAVVIAMGDKLFERRNEAGRDEERRRETGHCNDGNSRRTKRSLFVPVQVLYHSVAGDGRAGGEVGRQARMRLRREKREEGEGEGAREGYRAETRKASEESMRKGR
ncbi:hypothetical protein FQN55_004076 [Onygenales sp. PD_40]|nr:hypothetical protein FQN55_004076 [Onygenales sp. PD_40]